MEGSDMVPGKWRWRERDYTDNTKGQMIEERWISDEHGQNEFTGDGKFPFAVFLDPSLTQIGSSQHTKAAWVRLHDGTRVYRVTQVVRVS